jgi:predicted nucleotidyltransferase
VQLPRDEILHLASQHGVHDVRVFGSHARDEAGPGSDLDLLVRMAPGRDLFDLVAFKRAIEKLLRLPVDVVSEGGLSPWLRDRILAEARPL